MTPIRYLRMSVPPRPHYTVGENASHWCLCVDAGESRSSDHLQVLRVCLVPDEQDLWRAGRCGRAPHPVVEKTTGYRTSQMARAPGLQRCGRLPGELDPEGMLIALAAARGDAHLAALGPVQERVPRGMGAEPLRQVRDRLRRNDS